MNIVITPGQPRFNVNMRHVPANVMGYVPGFSRNKNQWHDDPILIPLLDEQGVDIEQLRSWYSLIPSDDEFVYSDVGKYFGMDLSDTAIFDLPLVQSCKWLHEHLANVITRSPKILSLQEVIQLIDGSKSATVFLSSQGHFKNKTAVFAEPSFYPAYYNFVRGAINKQVDCLFSACQKEEIRPTPKIKEGKGRAFIIAPIFHLMLDHQLTYDFDLDVFANWHRADSGIGMSLFGGRYHDKMSDFMEFEPNHGARQKPVKSGDYAKAFYDVGKWDKKMQYVFAMAETEVVNLFHEKMVPLSKFIPEEYQLPDDPKMVDTYELRRWITHQAMCSFVKLPNGEIVFTQYGQKSGDGRTGSRNTNVHKMYTFMAAILFEYVSRKQFVSENRTDHTGDDDITNGLVEYFNFLCKFLRDTLHYEVDSQIVYGGFIDYGEKIDADKAVHYLSTIPIRYEYLHKKWWVPYMDPAKILASLAFKSKSDRGMDILQRLLAARVLLRYTEANDMLKDIIERYVLRFKDRLSAEKVPIGAFLWTDDYVDGFYTGLRESADDREKLEQFEAGLAEVWPPDVTFLH